MSLERIRKLGCNTWKIGSLPFHWILYLAVVLVPCYFVFPHYLMKAAPIWLCCLSCIFHNSNKYTWYIAVGLLFGSFGDIFLEMKDAYGVDMFIPGLIAFLIGHLFYIRAFLHFPPQRKAVYFAGPICCAYYGTVMSFLLPNVSVLLIAPIAIYGSVITTMVFFGINRFLLDRSFSLGTRIMSLLGSIFFVCSDTLLSFNSFYHSVPHSGILIMITYYLGQILFAASTQFPIENEVENLLYKDSAFDHLLVN